MTRSIPKDPLIIVLGATGTGKSQLAVNLATRFNGEIINGDAVQMYAGLPIITNKISVEEQNGIPHHLLGVVPMSAETWTIGTFKKNASQIIEEIRSRGRLPIVVGGTHYYTQSLLFEDSLASTRATNELSVEELSRRFPILDGPTNEILAKLKEVDPVMAERWHPNDRRKIQTSLRIFLTSGKRASDIYKEQREDKAIVRNALEEVPGSQATFDIGSPLLFWVHSESDVLKTRLDDRVDKMVRAGLLDEVTSLDATLQHDTSGGAHVDLSRGIWASIGWKEFKPYLQALREGGANQGEHDTLYRDSLDRMKAATRQYAKRQVRWIRLKLIPELLQRNALQRLYLLDGTDISSWARNVSDPAISVTQDFLSGNELPSPSGLSSLAQEFLNTEAPLDHVQSKDQWVKKVCEICHTVLMTEKEWKMHFTTRAHRRMVRKQNNVKSTHRIGNTALSDMT